MSIEEQRQAPPRSLGTTPCDDNEQDVGFDFVIDFLTVVGEYGGVMNTTFMDAARLVNMTEYY